MPEIIIDIIEDMPVVIGGVWPSNSHKQRVIKEKSVLSTPVKVIDNHGRQAYFYVRIKYTVWPEIYGKQMPIHFPTLEAALRFAKNNLSVNKPQTRVYSPDDKLVETFEYKET